jgi:hypothetical protein
LLKNKQEEISVCELSLDFKKSYTIRTKGHLIQQLKMVDSPAIDTKIGQFTVDPNGNAQYSFQIIVPPGTGNGNEPDLSLQYSQGLPNGVMGIGWCLGGLSSIQTVPASFALDTANDASNYDPTEPRLALDGPRMQNMRLNSIRLGNQSLR